MGRPKLGKLAKTKTIRVRFTPDEHRRIERAARRAGLTISDHVRAVLLASGKP